MNWLAVRVRPGASRDRALAALFEIGSEGVHEAGDELVTHFPGDTDAEMVRAALMEADPSAHVTATLIPAVDWAEEWKKGVGAHDLGALVHRAAVAGGRPRSRAHDRHRAGDGVRHGRAPDDARRRAPAATT